ncbi:sigma-70 family RNA polymerase sigma factor [Dyadobacter sp. CY345]|uniref:RNA polymerase sigma factor n=1 Tax=Dyadobacter sp. CY345 TaxID=2909335 RepID=UPI001F20779B|nr:sigma-70 family RNA polymerase sigma factor [Dyadobacter sp. CY345]MCF2442981.1 sigma-70 family RNA polymerase sigma factor [Dyadobacter sp. CY345]
MLKISTNGFVNKSAAMSSTNKSDFVQVIQRHQGIINSICRFYYIDDEDVKDARQDIILQLWKSSPTFRGESKISTWIYRVALNTIISKVKSERKNNVNESLSDIHLNNNAVLHSEERDDIQQLLFLVNQLEATDKGIMILHFEGYSNKEIAETLKLSPTNISTRMNRIKTKLKETFKVF